MECGALAKRRGQGDITTEAANHRANKGQTYTFTGLGLGAGTTEEFENALVVGRGDTAPVVLYVDQDAISTRMVGTNGHTQGPVGLLILDGIVEQIAQHLLDGELVGDNRIDV